MQINISQARARSQAFVTDESAPRTAPQVAASCTPETLAHQELRASAIDPSLIGLAVEVAPDIEIDPLTNEAIATPIDDALGTRYRRFGHQARVSEAGLIFRNADGTLWQVKRGIGRDNRNGRTGRYLAPSGIGNAIYTPALPSSIVAKICERHGLDTTAQTEIERVGFWQWVLEHPELPIVVTEGGKKALAALSQGYIAIALYGCRCGHSEALQPYLHDRKIVAALDRDTSDKARKAVAIGHYSLNSAAREQNADLTIAHWQPEQGKGLDDLVAQSGIEALEQALENPEGFDLWVQRRAVRNRLGKYHANLRVNVSCLSAIAPESIPSSGTVAIVGNTGTGKTKLLSLMMATIDAALAPNFRISLARGLSNRLGITYLADADRVPGYLMDSNGQPTRRIGLCWDSLLAVPMWLYSDGSYDLILDEADQGFKHLISGGTCGKDGKRPALVQRAIALIKGARRVILASATLTHRELDLVAQLRGETPWVLVNDYQANSYPVTLYQGQRGVKGSSGNARATAIAAIVTDLKAGKRITVATDQLLTCKMVAAIGEKFGLQPHQLLRFDRETSSEDWQREFADAPDAFLERNDIRLLVHSPSLTSGISIEGDRFDLAIGIFEGQSISPDDALQALARVRKPIPRVVYASYYGKGNSQIDATRKADYAEQYQRRTKLIGHVSGHTIAASATDPIAEYHCATQADRNAAMATFSASLQARLEAAGNAVTIGTVDNEPTDAIALWREARKQVQRDRDLAIHSAAILSEADATELRSKRNLKHADALKLARWELCDWYGLDHSGLTLEDIERDRQGRTRREIARLEGLLWQDLSRSKDRADLQQLNSHNAPIQQHDLPARELASQTAIALGIPELLLHCLESEGWHAGTDWVREFVTKLREYAADMKLAIGFRIRANMTDCQIIGMVLRRYGLATKSRQLGTGADRYRVYQLDSESIEFAQSVLQQRSQRHIDKGLQPNTDPLTKLLLESVCVPPESPPILGQAAPPLPEKRHTHHAIASISRL